MAQQKERVEKYDRTKDVHAALRQAFEDYKIELNGQHKWNRNAEEIEGITMRLMGEDTLEITWHYYDFGTVETLALMEDYAKQYLDDFAKNLKEKFKKSTKVGLKLTKKDSDIIYEKVRNMDSDTSWAFGTKTQVTSPLGQYLVRERRTYKYSIEK